MLASNPTAKRDQRCYTFAKLGDARAERAKIIADRKAGTLVRRTKITLDDAITAWLDGKRNLRVSTKRNYEDSLRLVSDRLGHVQLQHLTKAHLDNLVTDLQKSGRRVGNKQQ